jgi:hypothetical protein
MYLVGSRGQQVPDLAYRLDGAIISATASQIVTPIPLSRSHYVFQNTSAATLYLEFGSARATATIAGGQVTGCTITNGGKGFLKPPLIEFQGGAAFNIHVGAGPSGASMPGYSSPNYAIAQAAQRPALAHCVLTAGVVTSIVMDDPGQGYAFAPWVTITNDPADRYGGADPFFGGTPSGMQIGAGGGSYYVNGTVCDIEQIYVYGATIGSTYFFRWMQ